MKRILIPVTALLLICACRSKQTETAPPEGTQTDTAKKNYLPVADYLKGEIALVDSFPHLLFKYQVINGKTDSGIITTPVFDQLAKEFLLADLDSSYFEKNFERYRDAVSTAVASAGPKREKKA